VSHHREDVRSRLPDTPATHAPLMVPANQPLQLTTAAGRPAASLWRSQLNVGTLGGTAPVAPRKEYAIVTVERIFTRNASGAGSTEHTSVQVTAGAGIEGDRYFGRHEEPGRNVTFIEAEELESFFTEQDMPFDASASGRNIVTRGVRLNELVGVEFLVGSVRFLGVELCEPCLGLGKALATSTHPPAKVVKRLVHRAGLRADALSSGEVVVGAKVKSAA
jgi:MOSC domain-containing protein YiiM